MKYIIEITQSNNISICYIAHVDKAKIAFTVSTLEENAMVFEDIKDFYTIRRCALADHQTANMMPIFTTEFAKMQLRELMLL